MLKGVFILLITVFTIFNSYAEKRPELKECIVMLDGNIDEFCSINEPFIESYKTLSPNLKIYLLKLNVSYYDIREKLVASPMVLSFQTNGRSTRRLVPNDALYPSQTQMKKMGLEQAWEGINSGLTGNNDTIVIAIIDDGVDVTNPELSQNAFINYHEIPNDNIDNDSNGYIDDYKGWNAIQHSDSIFDPTEKARHGSLVTGVIAAQGNNSIGITGVNLNIKYLTIVGGITDADIIESYDYVLSMKRLYIETKGKKGAYIVSSNSSFGRDRAREEDAPMWCAMYDSMGKYGIISMGATTNSNANIDLEGDLPSDCSSEFTLIVTDINDENKIAGYGEIGVDIAAFGSNTLSTASRVDTANIGWFKRFSGTSAATPYVAGAVGVLYSNACQSFLNLHDRRPDSAALLVKQFILEGARFSNYLNGKVTSDGILEVNEMLKKMDQWCFKNQTNVIDKQIVEFNVYPNPAKEEVWIELQDNLSAIILYDNLGRIVYERTIGLANKNLENKYVLPLTNFIPGLYFLRLVGEDGQEIGVTSLQKL